MASRKTTVPKPAGPPAGPAPVSMADLARELNVSMTTISRALSDHFSIGPAMKQKVQELARRHNYQPNHMASALRKGRSKLLGVLVPYIEGHFFPSVVHGIETVASQAGYNVIICQSNDDVAQERRNLESLLSAQVAGVLVSVSRTTRDHQHFDQLRRRGLPLVYFDRVPPGEVENAVVLDDHEGGYLATRHLLAQGCRRVAHLAGPQHLSIYHHRLAGYRTALREAGHPADEALVVYSEQLQPEGAAALRQLRALPDPPDGVFAASDFCALGALQEARRLGLRVPADVAIAGFSNEAFTLVAEPNITTVDQRCEEMGQAAVRLLLEAIGAGGAGFAPRQVALRPELLVRGSSCRRPAGAAAAGPGAQ